jgi:hypothetical protein
MAGDTGRGQCRDNDQAPAAREGAPLGGPHRWGYASLLVETSRLAFLNSRADAAFMQFKVGADGALGR